MFFTIGEIKTYSSQHLLPLSSLPHSLSAPEVKFTYRGEAHALDIIQVASKTFPRPSTPRAQPTRRTGIPCPGKPVDHDLVNRLLLPSLQIERLGINRQECKRKISLEELHDVKGAECRSMTTTNTWPKAGLVRPQEI